MTTASSITQEESKAEKGEKMEDEELVPPKKAPTRNQCKASGRSWTFKLVTWNTQGQESSVARVIHQLLAEFEVVCLQECSKTFWEQYQTTKKSSTPPVYYTLCQHFAGGGLEGKSGSEKGRAVYKDLIIMVRKDFADAHGTFLCAFHRTVPHQRRAIPVIRFGGDFEVHSVHLNSGAYKKNNQTLNEYSGSNLPKIVVGDQNITETHLPLHAVVPNYKTRPKSNNTLDFAVPMGNIKINALSEETVLKHVKAAGEPHNSEMCAGSDHYPVGFQVTVPGEEVRSSSSSSASSSSSSASSSSSSASSSNSSSSETKVVDPPRLRKWVHALRDLVREDSLSLVLSESGKRVEALADMFQDKAFDVQCLEGTLVKSIAGQSETLRAIIAFGPQYTAQALVCYTAHEHSVTISIPSR